MKSKDHRSRAPKRISLLPLTAEQALRAAMQTPTPPGTKRGKAKARGKKK